MYLIVDALIELAHEQHVDPPTLANHYLLLKGWKIEERENHKNLAPLIFKHQTYMKKILDSDFLRAVQFKCNNIAKNVHLTPVQMTHLNSGL